ncbi:MAG: SitI3 family protein [Elusimicrobia bacterium]|nr:SitI3 family protein [Elusimicrobiota bacterium]
MSIEYELHFADPRPAEGLLAAAKIGEVRGLTLHPGRPQPPRVHAIREAYGFISQADLVVRLDLSVYNADDGYAGNFNLIRVLMALLKVAQGDMVVLFNWELPILMRRGGQVILETDRGWWKSPALRGLVDVPYIEESLPSL